MFFLPIYSLQSRDFSIGGIFTQINELKAVVNSLFFIYLSDHY